MTDILLATFNGEPYLRAFLDSLVAQTEPDWRLCVRDDGSTDGTLAILQAAASRDARIELVASAGREGPLRGYSTLLARPSDAAYTAFADQDDVWLPAKIERLLRAMKTAEASYADAVPVLVHSDLEVTDAALNRIAPSFWKFTRLDPAHSSFPRLLAQNMVTGCAMMVNRAARTGVGRIPDDAIMHDGWIALYVAAAGTIVPVDEPLIRYRQHASNTIGAESYDLRSILRAASNPGRLRDRIERTRTQARAFAKQYASVLPDRFIRTAADFGAAPERSALRRRIDIVRNGTWKQGLIRNIALLIYA